VFFHILLELEWIVYNAVQYQSDCLCWQHKPQVAWPHQLMRQLDTERDFDEVEDVWNKDYLERDAGDH
jgi:hypothetical protein